jgi:cytochrome c biogenesis protein CcmG/thiol:disulfide interchange protein DsbE
MAGSYVLITFGGPSCSPCVAEHYDLMPIWTRFRDRGFSVVSILHDTPERGWEWLKPRAPQSFPMLVDEGFEVAKKYGVRGIPRTYLIGPSGDVVQTWLGWTSMRSEELSRALDGLLPPLESRSR